MSTAPIEDDRPRTLIPSKLGKQAGGIRGGLKTPCSRKVGVVEAAKAEVVSSDDDFEVLLTRRMVNLLLVLLLGEVGRMLSSPGGNRQLSLET